MTDAMRPTTNEKKNPLPIIVKMAHTWVQAGQAKASQVRPAQQTPVHSRDYKGPELVVDRVY